MTSKITFIYDGECPFCNQFAELLEIKSHIKNIKILDGRKNLNTIKLLIEKGYDLDKGAILMKDNEIFHVAEAINTICNQINNPSSNLLRFLSKVVYQEIQQLSICLRRMFSFLCQREKVCQSQFWRLCIVVVF